MRSRLALATVLLVGTAALLILSASARADDEADDSDSGGSGQNISSKGGSLKRHSGEVVDWWYNRALMPLVWDPDPAKPISKIEIRIGECKLFVYQGDKVVGATSISTGKEGHATQTGTFAVTQKDKDHHSNLYGSFVDGSGNTVSSNAQSGQAAPAGSHYEAAPMLWFLRLSDDGTGLHAGYVTGTPASHGCIRLPPPFAEDLFALAQVGTKVEIKP